MIEIPKRVTNPNSKTSELSRIAQELPPETKVPESIPYLISFARYKDKLCEISILSKNKAKKTLLILKEIGTKIFCKADFQRFGIKTHRIDNKGEYKKLYYGLGPDIEVRELFLQGTGRIFYFTVEPERILYIVAIRENHFEVDKVRR